MQKWLTKMVVQPLTIFGKRGTFSFISQKIRNTVPADFFHF